MTGTITELLMPDGVIKVINDWGKSQNNVNFKNRLDLWDHLKQKYDWENEDLDVPNGKVEVEPRSNYPRIAAEIPGVCMGSDLQPENGTVQAEPVPSMSYLATAAHANAGLAPTTMVSQATGVVPTHNVVDLTQEDDDNDNEVCVEDVPDDKDDDDDDNNVHKNETQEPVISKKLRLWYAHKKTTRVVQTIDVRTIIQDRY